jgi:hypothetical protein
MNVITVIISQSLVYAKSQKEKSKYNGISLGAICWYKLALFLLGKN